MPLALVFCTVVVCVTACVLLSGLIVRSRLVLKIGSVEVSGNDVDEVEKLLQVAERTINNQVIRR